MIDFLLHLTLVEQILLGLLSFVFLYQIYFYLRYLASPIRLSRKQEKVFTAETPQPFCPPVSVIVCAKNEDDNLSNYLHTLLTQDYPEYEVIAINDGSEDNTASVLAQYAQAFPNLHLTFVPTHAQVRSSKKLALTLGLKAAKYDYVLLTDADCRPQSPQWISHMMQGFADGEQTELVLGYGAYFKEKSFVNKCIQYDTLFNGLQYMGLALAHHPYMGVGRNLAYRKDTFFNHNGFAGLLGSRAGDDDLFVNKVATRRNTQVVLTRDSLTWSIPKRTFAEWLMQKERHLGVSPQYRFGTKCRLFFEPFSRALFYATIILLGILSPNWILWTTASSTFVLRWLMQCAVLNTAARRLQGERFYLSILFFDIFLPLNNIFLFVRHAFRKRFLKVEIW